MSNSTFNHSVLKLIIVCSDMSSNISGKNIKLLRVKHGWGQIELTAALNVDHGIKIEQSDLSEVERGIRRVPDYELKAFADVLGVTTDQLLEGE